MKSSYPDFNHYTYELTLETFFDFHGDIKVTVTYQPGYDPNYTNPENAQEEFRYDSISYVDGEKIQSLTEYQHTYIETKIRQLYLTEKLEAMGERQIDAYEFNRRN